VFGQLAVLLAALLDALGSSSERVVNQVRAARAGAGRRAPLPFWVAFGFGIPGLLVGGYTGSRALRGVCAVCCAGIQRGTCGP
jgi:hypothetical protein